SSMKPRSMSTWPILRPPPCAAWAWRTGAALGGGFLGPAFLASGGGFLPSPAALGMGFLISPFGLPAAGFFSGVGFVGGIGLSKIKTNHRVTEEKQHRGVKGVYCLLRRWFIFSFSVFLPLCALCLCGSFYLLRRFGGSSSSSSSSSS